MTVFQESAEATTAEKQLRITGVPDKVDYAKQLVIDLLTEKEIENIRLKTGGRGDKNSNTNDYGTSRSGYIEIPVPPQFIGLVIGKGGESIRRIQQETQTKVQFDTHKSDAKGNKICQISGPPDAIDRATAMIRDIIDNANVSRRVFSFFIFNTSIFNFRVEEEILSLKMVTNFVFPYLLTGSIE